MSNGTEGFLSITEAAELLNVCKDTVRKRIKAGEIKAELIEGFYGKQYFIDPSQFDTAAVVRDVAILTRQVTVAELQFTLSKVISDTVAAAVEEQTKAIKEEYQENTHRLSVQLEAMHLQLAMTQEELKKAQAAQGEQLRQVVEQSSRSLLSRIFGGR